MIGPEERVSDVLLRLLRVGHNGATLRNWLIAEMAHEEVID